jgi:hypothetical protein
MGAGSQLQDGAMEQTCHFVIVYILIFNKLLIPIIIIIIIIIIINILHEQNYI